MQRIDESRVSATQHRHLLMFAELTGPKSAKNVVLATTTWDKLSEDDDGDEWEKSLKEEYWNVMIHHGAAVERFFNTSDSAWSIVNNMVKKTVPKAALLFQEEMIDQKKHFASTSAREALDLNLGKLIDRQKGTMKGLVGQSNSNGSGNGILIESP